MRVRIKKVHPEAIIPRYMTAGAAGMDLAAALDEPIVIEPGKRVPVSTGLAMEIEQGFEGQLRPRSSLARDHGITLANSVGTIDCDYRGTVIVVLVNHGDRAVTIRSKDRICQLVVAPVVQAEIEEATELSTTERGAGGFGSTGKA